MNETRQHVRSQLCFYFANLLLQETGISCDVHRQTVIPREAEERLDVTIVEEGTAGDGAGGELEQTFETTTRIAPLIVLAKVTGIGAYTRCETIAGQVEAALIGGASEGNHTIDGKQVSIEYVGAAGEPGFDDSQTTDYEIQIMFNCSYRTPIGDPFTLK